MSVYFALQSKHGVSVCSSHLANTFSWPSYRSTILTEPGSRVTFEWETVELMFGQIERTLVYDPSDSEAQEANIPITITMALLRAIAIS